MSAVRNGSPRRSEVARRRWKLLAQALQRHGMMSQDDISLRRFTSYGLVCAQPLPLAGWYKYTAIVEGQQFSVHVRHPVRPFTAAELMGFNNTGNVCVWPSEEVLAYHILCHRADFAGKSVLELGGGMTCLAGLMTAKYTSATSIHLTDGNRSAVENVGCIIEKNGFAPAGHVSFSILQWGASPCKMYDIVLSADCLFFDDARSDLVETMWQALRDDGMALVVAPRRGGTLDQFASQARARGFICKGRQRYNDLVWARHQTLKQSCAYDEDIHYPLLLQLTKSYTKNAHDQC